MEYSGVPALNGMLNMVTEITVPSALPQRLSDSYLETNPVAASSKTLVTGRIHTRNWLLLTAEAIAHLLLLSGFCIHLSHAQPPVS